jgi:hypothetical protein
MNPKIRAHGSIISSAMATLSALVWLLSSTFPARAQFPIFPICGGPGRPPCLPITPICGTPGTLPCPTPACGSPGAPPCASTLLDSYYNVTANGNVSSDNTVNLINPIGTPTTGPGAAASNVCAMIYVFDHQEEMGECCGCPLSPQKLLTLSVHNNLTSNPTPDLLGTLTTTGLIEIVSAPPNAVALHPPTNGQGCGPEESTACNGGCDPTNLPGFVPAPELKGYITHAVASPEVPFVGAGDPDMITLTYLSDQCAAIVGLGEEVGSGICNCGGQ